MCYLPNVTELVITEKIARSLFGSLRSLAQISPNSPSEANQATKKISGDQILNSKALRRHLHRLTSLTVVDFNSWDEATSLLRATNNLTTLTCRGGSFWRNNDVISALSHDKHLNVLNIESVRLLFTAPTPTPGCSFFTSFSATNFELDYDSRRFLSGLPNTLEHLSLQFVRKPNHIELSDPCFKHFPNLRSLCLRGIRVGRLIWILKALAPSTTHDQSCASKPSPLEQLKVEYWTSPTFPHTFSIAQFHAEELAAMLEEFRPTLQELHVTQSNLTPESDERETDDLFARILRRHLEDMGWDVDRLFKSRSSTVDNSLRPHFCLGRLQSDGSLHSLDFDTACDHVEQVLQSSLLWVDRLRREGGQSSEILVAMEAVERLQGYNILARY
ncbi:hypothetical protein T439DRAFT_133738 [Meredithblackwellia eburnea MCA 4105]